MPPQVRDLYELIDQQNKALDPQYNLLDQQIASNDQSGQAQIAGIDATKNKAFKQIGQQSQNNGMFFSGFTPNEQADYLGTTYLPALANLQSQIAQTRQTLLGKKADLWAGAWQRGTDIHESDIAAKRTFDNQQQQQQFQAQQAQLDRDFQARESAKDRAAAAANAAASRSSASPAEVLDADRRAIASELSKVTGGDGYVSPGSYATMKNQWQSAGYDGKTFDAYFQSYRNPKNTAYSLTK